MKVKTSHGEVELTAEMVCRGMVLQSDDWIQNAARDGVLTMLHADPQRPECWKTTVDESWCYPEHARRLLGCDPTIAARADCERFGVHGDAGAHGFTRLRDGGAVDLKKGDVPGIRYHVRGMGATTWKAGADWHEGDRFIGLDSRYASPEDIRRLCCGVYELDVVYGETYTTGKRCTLAIGEHDHHEDLASGVRWPAKPTTVDDKGRVQEPPAAALPDHDDLPVCGCGAEVGQGHFQGCEAALVALVRNRPEWAEPTAWAAAVLAVHEMKGAHGWKDAACHQVLAMVFGYSTLRAADAPTETARIAVNAYQRALAPAAKVAPERKRRGPVVIQGDWEDE